MFHHLSRYLSHVKRQSHAIKEVHALLFATLGTLLFVFAYLYVGSVSSDEDKNGKPVVSTTFESPFQMFSNQVKQIFIQVKQGGIVEVVNESQ